MATPRRRKLNLADIKAWLEEDAAFQLLNPAERKQVRFFVERAAPPILRCGERAILLLPKLRDAWVSDYVATRYEDAILKVANKDNLETYIKASSHARKSTLDHNHIAFKEPRKRPVKLTDPITALMRQGRGAAEEAIAETRIHRSDYKSDEIKTEDDAHDPVYPDMIDEA